MLGVLVQYLIIVGCPLTLAPAFIRELLRVLFYSWKRSALPFLLKQPKFSLLAQLAPPCACCSHMRSRGEQKHLSESVLIIHSTQGASSLNHCSDAAFFKRADIAIPRFGFHVHFRASNMLCTIASFFVAACEQSQTPAHRAFV